MSSKGKNARDQRRENAYLVLTVVRESKSISRRDLARNTGLSVPSISQIVEYLTDLKLLRAELGVLRTQRRIPLFSFSGEQYAVLGLQITRSSVRGVGCDLNGEVFERFLLTYHSDDLNKLIDGILLQVRALKSKAEARGQRVLGLGIGSPGPIDTTSRSIIMTTDFHHWNEISLGPEFEKKAGLPVILEKNPNLCAFAEHKLGAGRHTKNAIYLEISSGIGLAVIYDGKIFKGDSGLYCEIGHTSVNSNGPQCECGNRGCLEMYAKESVVEARLQESATPEDRAAVLREAADHLSTSMANVVSLTGVRTVVIGGRLVHNHMELFQLLRELIPQRTFPKSRYPLEIKSSQLGAGSAALGAALWVGESALLHLNSGLFAGESSDKAVRLERVV